jgi:hypothetical protein
MRPSLRSVKARGAGANPEQGISLCVPAGGAASGLYCANRALTVPGIVGTLADVRADRDAQLAHWEEAS